MIYNQSAMNMVRLQLIYPEDLVKEPILCMVCKNFNVILNIRTAKVTRDTGILSVEIDGDSEEIERAIKFIEEKGVRVQPIEGQVFME